MDYLDAPLQKDCAARLAVVGGSPRMTSAVAFALARRAAERDVYHHSVTPNRTNLSPFTKGCRGRDASM